VQGQSLLGYKLVVVQGSFLPTAVTWACWILVDPVLRLLVDPVLRLLVDSVFHLVTMTTTAPGLAKAGHAAVLVLHPWLWFYRFVHW
jgi:hypothetical protein